MPITEQLVTFQTDKSSQCRRSIKKAVRKNLQYMKSLFNKVTVLRSVTLLKKRFFPVNIAKFLRAPILKNIYLQMILN